MESEERDVEVKQNIRGGSIDLTTGSPTKKIIIFTLPLLLGNVFQLFYSWTDAIMLGNLKGDALQFGALSASMPILNLLLTVVMGFLAGAVVVIGQKFGSRDYNALKRCYSTLLITLLALTVIFSVGGVLAARPLLRLIKVDETLIGYSTVYLQYYFGGLVFMVAYNAFSQTIRALGNSHVPLIALIICVLLNIVFDYVFVFIANMDIQGVALGTMLAQLISAVIMFVYIQRKVPLLRLSVKGIVFDKHLFKAMIALGVPSTIQNTCACVGYMVINGMINDKGKTFTTAFGLGNRIDELLTQILNSFGIAITSYAAQNKGKNEIGRIKKGFYSTMIIMTGLLLVLAVLIFIFKKPIINVFLNLDVENPGIDLNEVVNITTIFLNIYLPSYVLIAWMTVTSSLIRGTGAAVLAMSVNIFSFVVRMISAFVLNHYFLYGVFFASPIGWLAGTVWAFIIYMRGKWKKSEILP